MGHVKVGESHELDLALMRIERVADFTGRAEGNHGAVVESDLSALPATG